MKEKFLFFTLNINFHIKSKKMYQPNFSSVQHLMIIYTITTINLLGRKLSILKVELPFYIKGRVTFLY